jgi:hypothetical protein
MRRLPLALAACLAPGDALAHASERAVILTLPTGHYIAGAAAAVALTAVLGVLAPRIPCPRPRRIATLPKLPGHPGSWLAFVTLAALVALGFLGPRDPLENLLPLTVWTLLWVGLVLATIAFGNLWSAIDPWTAPVAATRRALGLTRGVGLSRLGLWPAVAFYFAFAWFEMIAPAPADPAVLARATLLYWLLIFALATLEGPAWLARGEALTVFFAFVARVAPLWTIRTAGRSELTLGPPGAQILALPPLAPGATAFITLALAAVTFDGFHETFRWLALIGVNPLDHPGRTELIRANTLGFLAAWALTAAAILGTVALGRRLARDSRPFWTEAGPALLSFLPIAAGYHAAHYLVSLLVGARYAVAALNDPLGRGWSLLGLPEHWVALGFLNNPASVGAIWNTQFAMILAAHVLAVILSLRLAGPRPAAAHLPMTLLMVLYTTLGLWLLSAAAVG